MPKAVPMKTNFTAGEISPLMVGRITHAPYQNGCLTLCNFFVRPHGGAVRRPGTRYVAEVKDSTKTIRLIPFTFSVFQSYVLELGDGYLRVFKDRGQVVTGATPYEISTPYSPGNLAAIKYCQSADRMFLVHPSYPPQELSRTGHTAWSLGTISFGSELSAPAGINVQAETSSGSVIHEYVVTALDEDLQESIPCSAGSDVYSTYDLDYAHHVKVTWNSVADAVEYRVYKNKDNNGVFGYLGRTTGVTFWDRGSVTPDLTETPPEALHPFDSTDNYPGSITFHQSRLAFAGTNNEPQTLWLSKTAAPTNMDKSSPALADDSCKFTLNADQVNVIRWLVSGRMLLIGSSGAEWHMSGSDGGAITPSSVSARRETQHGSSNVQPVVIGNVVLFVDRAGKTVRGYVYQLDADGYAGPNLSILAEHLTRTNTIIDWAYQPSAGLVWAVRDDGLLLSLTYEKDHEVVAWARHETGGQVESVCVIPGDDRDEVWLVVKRVIGGQTKRFVEFMEAEFNPSIKEDGQSDTTNAYFVDCGLTYDNPVEINAMAASSPVAVTTAAAHGFSAGDQVRITGVAGPSSLNGSIFQVANPATTTFELLTITGATVYGSGLTAYDSGGNVRKMITTISGLGHLAGEQIDVLADGAAHPRKVVTTGGTVTLDRPAAVVHLGLPYDFTLKPTHLEVGMPGGVSQSRAKRISKITARVHESLGMKMGPDEDNLDDVSFRSSADPMGSPPAVFTGDVDLTWPGGWERDGNIVIRQDQPLPLTLLGLIPRIHTSGR